MSQVSPELDMEALRIVSIFPRWIPARSDGEGISKRITMPITFRKDALIK